MAEVNDKGEVTVEGEFAGRLEGFRFHADPSASGDEARTLTRAAYEALRPEFHLRADRFYNAPDTELDFTEQGGLMWGTAAMGKLAKGADPLKPAVEAFVDEEAGPEIADKVRRRLQHFIDRKVATGFEPLLALKNDETLTGLARGFAFRLVEALGVLPREKVAAEVKDLDQESRGLLRKHGVRFGQYTIFLPLLLKPAPTRLRLVLWGLDQDLAEFPESPPPGLVTIPNLPDVPKGYYTLSGYHPAGERAIRIDMLERLADMLRAQDSRAGFEATPDMLSITGMTLEQFAGLMGGLGYRAEQGERPRTRGESASGPVAETVAETAPAGDDPAENDNPLTEEESVLQAETRARWEAEQAARKAAENKAEAEAGAASGAEVPVTEEVQAGEGPVGAEAAAAVSATDSVAETETFYSFTWPSRPRGNRRPQPEGERAQRGPRRGRGPEGASEAGPREQRPGGKPRQGGKPRMGAEDEQRGKGPRGGKPARRQETAKSFTARPPRAEKPIDPDSPFAVLAALKNKT